MAMYVLGVLGRGQTLLSFCSWSHVLLLISSWSERGVVSTVRPKELVAMMCCLLSLLCILREYISNFALHSLIDWQHVCNSSFEIRSFGFSR